MERLTMLGRLGLFVSAMMVGASLALGLALVGGCAQIERAMGPIDATNPLAVETADAIGYGIGLLAAKNETLRAKIEAYYAQIEAGGLTPAAVNGILDALGTDAPEYQFFAYKLTRVLTRAGGKFADGKIVDLQPIDPLLLEAAKQAYLLAFKTAAKK